jgi:hypothetical protein
VTPRQLEDLVVRCPVCGQFPSSQMFGARDWLLRHRPYDFDAWNEHAEELSQLIVNAKSSVVERLKNLIRPKTQPIDDDLEEEYGIVPSPREQPTVVTRERIDGDGDEPWPCDDRECEGELALTWNSLIAAHERLTADERTWLARYAKGKDLVRLGLFRSGNVAFETKLGTFVVKQTGELESPFGPIAPGSTPLFVPSEAIAKRVGAIAPTTMLEQLAGDDRCLPTADPDGDSLPFPIYFELPRPRVAIELPLDIAEVASELERYGATPLRGLGLLRLAEVDWVSVSGKLVYLDFDEPLRETLVAEVRGERW